MVENNLQTRRADAQRGFTDRGRDRGKRGACRNDNGRQRHQRQDQPADQRSRPWQLKETDKHSETQQPEHNRRHCREIVDIDFDDAGDAVFRGKLFKIYGRHDSNRKTDRQRHQNGQQRPDKGSTQTRHFRFAAVTGSKQRPGKLRVHTVLGGIMVEPDKLLIRHQPVAFGQCAVDQPLDQQVDIIRRRHGNPHDAADRLRIVEHEIAHPVAAPGRDQIV